MMKKELFFMAFVVFMMTAFIPFASADLVSEAEGLSEKIMRFTGGVDPVVIKGRYASAAELGLLSYFQGTYDEIASVPVIEEEDYSPEKYEGRALILVGGPNQNEITKRILDEVKDYEEEELSVGKVLFVDYNGIKVVIFSDNEGFSDVKKNISNSPLAAFIDPELVPAAATGTGLGLIILWKLLSGLIPKIVKFKVSSRIMKRVRKKDVRKEFLGLHLKGVRLKAAEWFCILVSALIFAVSLSYIYLAPETDVFSFLLITVLVNFVVYSIRHGMRLILDRHYDHHTEYHIWYLGAVITAITGWLGNTFSMAGYISSEKDSDYEGKAAFAINFVTFIFFAVFWMLNFLNPNVLLHMAMLLCLAITFLQMLPLSPFSGKNIFKWSKAAWILGFVPLLAVYVFVNLL